MRLVLRYCMWYFKQNKTQTIRIPVSFQLQRARIDFVSGVLIQIIIWTTWYFNVINVILLSNFLFAKIRKMDKLNSWQWFRFIYFKKYVKLYLSKCSGLKLFGDCDGDGCDRLTTDLANELIAFSAEIIPKVL